MWVRIGPCRIKLLIFHFSECFSSQILVWSRVFSCRGTKFVKTYVKSILLFIASFQHFLRNTIICNVRLPRLKSGGSLIPWDAFVSMQCFIRLVTCVSFFGVEGFDTRIDVLLGLQNATGWREGAWHLHMDEWKLVQEFNHYTLPGFIVILYHSLNLHPHTLK